MSETTTRKRGRPAVEAQSTLRDIVVENSALETLLDSAFKTEEAATTNRQSKKGVKKMMESEELRQYLNSDMDGTHSGFVICGDYRFRPRSSHRTAGKVEINVSEGENWENLAIEKI